MFKKLVHEVFVDKRYLLVLFAPLIFILAISAITLSEIKMVKHNEPFKITTGIVSKLDCNKFAPGAVGFLITYSINGVSYTERPGNDYISCDHSDQKLNLHDTVDVWVSQKNLHYISLGSPELVLDKKESVIFTLLIMSLFFLCLIFAYKYYEKKINK